MFIVYHSNSSELFMKLVIDIISNDKLFNPLQSEVILIENKVMEQWIELKFADYFGISANIKFMQIKSFIRKISTEFFSKNFIINDSDRHAMYWKFMEILPELCLKKECSIIQKYLFFDIKQKKCGQLAENLVNLFSEYLVYRSDWLASWQAGKIIKKLDIDNQIWQSEIWRIFLKKIQYNFQKFNFENFCISCLQNNIQKNDWSILPSRIFVYGVTSMPPVYWRILSYLSHYIDIYLWVISPNIKLLNTVFCSDFLKSVNTNEYKNKSCNNLFFMSKNIDHHYDEFSYSHSVMKFNHPLLQSWGTVGKETLFLLNKQVNDIFEIKDFALPKTNSMLHVLQRSIIECQNNQPDLKGELFSNLIKKNIYKYPLNSLDQSISIHECSNMYREIAVLHDNILLMLSDDPSLLPGDIVVMSPDIDQYTQIIKTVFNSAFGRKLPFSISNSSNDYTHLIILNILNILNISNSRFTIEEILSFLSVPATSAKFDLSNEEVKLLNIWIIESGIKWGLDEKTMHDFNCPVSDRNTWYFGLKRILLGYSISNEDSLWNSIFPYVHFHEDHIDILSKLVEFLEKLRKWRDRLSYLYKLEDWIINFKEIINDFFDSNILSSKEHNILFLLKTYWIDMLESGIQLNYFRTVSINVLRDKLIAKLSKKNICYRFLPNSVNFLNLIPICYIPCKILCIIGMNAGNFPRSNTLKYNFNLIPKQPRYGDNILLEKDNYIFLLSCLLPKFKLYFSFIKQSTINSSSIDCLSILVTELVQYIAQNFYLSKNKNLDLTNNMNDLYEFLLKKHSNMPFNHTNFSIQSKTPSFADEWLSAAKISLYSDTVNDNLKFVTMLPNISISTILLNDLYNFYKHPVRTWFQKRLSVYFYQYDQFVNLPKNEVFSVDNLSRFIINSKLVDYLIHNKDTDILYHKFYDSGFLPYGKFGKLFWIKQYEDMYILSNRIKMFYFPNETFNLDISLRFNKIELIGRLNCIQKNGLTRWKSSNLSMKDYLLIWLEHLVYCASGGIGDSRLFGINNLCQFSNFSKSKAEELLSCLISGYCFGMNTPLMLLYQCGGVWINHVFDKSSKTISLDKDIHSQAHQKLIQIWQGNSNEYFFDGKESNDPYLRKLIPIYLNQEYIQTIINTAENYFLHIMQYRIL